ncbi:MAG: tetratricopeptide repeat protein, partial [Gammaproteobacteria bacterium]|nr:tetratricopeptide repeat protein [Gammaproteobacteria bacterium]
VNIGRLLQEAGDYLAAQDHYEQALDTDPDNLLATFNLGTLLEDMGRIDEAISVYKQASSFPDAHYNLSRLYELVGQHADALRHLKAYRSLIDPA